MSQINLLLNYYIENSYLNLNNNIELSDLQLLLDSISKYNIIINCINIPSNFKYLDLIKEKYNNIEIKQYII
jgi:poly-D-alanine transfer protein DltD